MENSISIVNPEETEIESLETDFTDCTDSSSGPSSCKIRKKMRKSELGGMHCDVCLHYKASNPFTSEEGCTHFQNSMLMRHQECKSCMDSTLKLKLCSQFEAACQNAKQRFHDKASEQIQSYVKQL